MRRTFPVCCAPADEQSAKSIALNARTVIFFVMSLLPFLTLRSLPHALCSFYRIVYSPARGIRMEVSDQFVLFPRPLRERLSMKLVKTFFKKIFHAA
jgi:hypothetical protein